jgi:hypothetical protein
MQIDALYCLPGRSCPEYLWQSLFHPVLFPDPDPATPGRIVKILSTQQDSGNRWPAAAKIIYSGNTSEVCLQRNQGMEGGVTDGKR